jgi:UDP-2,3-diacylglucosamine pyrophosphatase LpxH
VQDFQPVKNALMERRKIQLAVISDVHLGTYGCHAKQLHRYLKSIEPDTLILNGDIIDIWQFSKKYWPASHMKVVRQILQLVQKGTKVHYITGNHDEMLRKFSGFEFGGICIENKLVLELDGRKAWFFHGDVFDVCMQHSRWLARLGAVGYDTLILINRAANWISERLGGGRLSLSKKVKNGVKSAVNFIGNFEQTCTLLAAEKGYDYVVCGHIHQPAIKTVETDHGPVQYLNSGDWIENLTALEYDAGNWKLFSFYESFSTEKETETEDIIPDAAGLFNGMLMEFGLQSTVR